MVSVERQRIMESNKSLRIIKNELESLLEKGAMTEDVFDNIQALLPTEASISSNVAAAAATPATATTTTSTAPTPTASRANNSGPASLTAAMSNLGVSPGPPSYAQSTTGGGAPTLPSRNPSPQPPTRVAIAHARALYTYAGQDARDCALERDDRVAVLQYMNADWWMGRNLRTGREGIFPRNYVEIEPESGARSSPWGSPSNEKAQYGGGGGGYGAPYMTPAVQEPQYAGGYPGASQPPNPYSSSVPPMAVANQQPQQQQEGGESKLGGAGKKIGKKLGNAAIFGAGATIGSNIVNSIF